MNYLKELTNKKHYKLFTDKEIQVPDVVNLFMEKYSITELNINKSKCVAILSSRINTLNSTFRYLLQEQYVDDCLPLEYNMIDFDRMILLYNKKLALGYNKEDINDIDNTLINLYKNNYQDDYDEHLYIDDMDVIISLYETLTYDHRCCLILMETLESFFDVCLDTNRLDLYKQNMFFSFLYSQLEYFIFILTLNSLLQHNINENYVKNHSYIDWNVYKTSIFLDYIFYSKKGLYQEGSNIEDIFLNFIDTYRRELTRFVMDPNSNRIDLFNFLKEKSNISPISIAINNNNILPLTDNMISFDYLQNFITSYIHMSSNSNWRFLSLILKWHEKLIKE